MEDGGVGLVVVMVGVSEQPGGDVDGQAAAGGFGGEHPAEVVRGEPQRFPGLVTHPGARQGLR